MTTLTLQVTEVRFDFDDLDFTLEEQQAVLDDVLGNVFEVEVDDANDDEVVADALVEEVTDYAGWCVCSLDFVTFLTLTKPTNDSNCKCSILLWR
jgi:hypothetical protein